MAGDEREDDRGEKPVPRDPPPPAERQAGPGADTAEGAEALRDEVRKRVRGERDPRQLYESNALGEEPEIGEDGEA